MGVKFFAWISSRETASYAVSALFHALLLAYLAVRARPVFQLPTTYGEVQISAIDATWVEPAPIDVLDEIEEIDARVVVTPDRATIDDRDFVPAPSMPEPQLAETQAAAGRPQAVAAEQRRQPVEREQPPDEPRREPTSDPTDAPAPSAGTDPSEPLPEQPRRKPAEAADRSTTEPSEPPEPDEPTEPSSDEPSPAENTPVETAKIEASADKGQTEPDHTDTKPAQIRPDRPDARPPKSPAAKRAPRRPPPQPSSRAQTAGTQTTEPPRVERNPPPLYPATAVDQGWEGITTLRIHIAKDGTVEAVEVLQSSGHSVLDAAAVRAVRKWRFSPAMRDGKPVPIHVRLKIRFSLD